LHSISIIQIYQLTQMKQSSLMSDYRLLCILETECLTHSFVFNVNTFKR